MEDLDLNQNARTSFHNSKPRRGKGKTKKQKKVIVEAKNSNQF